MFKTWYCPLKSKFFLSKKLRWRFYVASSSLSLRPIQIRQPIDLSVLQSHQTLCLSVSLSLCLSLCLSLSLSLFLSLNVGIICPNNTFCYIYNCLLLITPPPWSVPIAMSLTFLIRLLSKRFSLPTFLKTKFSPPVLHLFFHLFTEVLINFGYFKEKFLMADDVPNFNASSQLPTSLLTFWGSLSYTSLVYHVTYRFRLQQNSTQHSLFLS